MRKIATIIFTTGEKVSLDVWQQIYDLPVGSSKIGRHFYIGEPNFKNGLTIAEPVIRILDEVREMRGRALNVNSLDREQKDQDRLKDQGYRTATFSPHVFKMAADPDAENAKDTKDLAKTIKKAAKKLGYKVRIGYKKYIKDGHSFAHFDVCPEYFAKGKPFHHINHPWQWEKELNW